MPSVDLIRYWSKGDRVLKLGYVKGGRKPVFLKGEKSKVKGESRLRPPLNKLIHLVALGENTLHFSP
jgi:hypothetical protein